MTYEEALNRLLQVAGDYNSIYNARVVGEALARKELEQANDEVKSLIEEISPSPQLLNITLNSSGYTVISVSQISSTFYKWIYGVSRGSNMEKEIKLYLESILLGFLRNCANMGNNTLDDLIRINSCVSLAYRNITPELIGKIAAAVRKWHVKKAEADEDRNNFNNYRASVHAAINDVSICWLREVEIIPGMKLSIRNLKTHTSEDRTVKKVSYSNGVRVLAFKENSSVIKGDDRIISVRSWLLNNPEYSDLAKIYD